MKVEELGAEKDRSLGPSHAIVDQRMRLGEVVGGGRAVHQCLGAPELEQQVRTLWIRRRLCERAAEVGDGALGRTAAGRASGRLTQRGDGIEIGGGGGGGAGGGARG